MSNEIQFKDGQILFVDGQIAMDPACCCNPNPCAGFIDTQGCTTTIQINSTDSYSWTRPAPPFPYPTPESIDFTGVTSVINVYAPAFDFNTCFCGLLFNPGFSMGAIIIFWRDGTDDWYCAVYEFWSYPEFDTCLEAYPRSDNGGTIIAGPFLMGHGGICPPAGTYTFGTGTITIT